MPTKLQTYRQMSADAASHLTDRYENWTAFLETAARLYKYPYHEQLMIHAQRPDATACAEYDFWNRWGRYVKRGSKGIALIDTSGDRPRLRYVFDVSDTGELKSSKAVNLWQYHDKHKPAIAAMLYENFDVPKNNDLAVQIENVAVQLADEYFSEHRRDILDIVDDSFLYGYDEYAVGIEFRTAAAVSITYSVMSRCGMNTGEYFSHEDFLSVFNWNTPEAVSELGSAISTINETLLRQIERVIKSYEREHSAERTEYYGTELHEDGGLLDPEPHPVGADNSDHWEIRENEEEVPRRAPTGTLQQTDSVGEAVPAPEGDRRDGTAETGADDARADEAERSDGEPERERPDLLGGAYEQLEVAGGGDDPDRADIQLSFGVPYTHGGQISMFPSEEEQIEYITEAESVLLPFAFSMSIPQDVIDHVLRLGGNRDSGRMEIATEFSKRKSTEDIAEYLHGFFRGGNGIISDSGRHAAWYAEDGIHIANGSSARYLNSAFVLPWESAAERIGEMLHNGTFATNVELAEMQNHERTEIAKSLWFIYHDMSEKARDLVYLSALNRIKGGGFPDETKQLSNELRDNAMYRAELTAQFKAFREDYANDRTLLRFHHYNIDRVYQSLQELEIDRQEYTSEMPEVPETKGFITEDEIAEALANGSGFQGGKGRIYEYFTASHTTKEQADFLKDEYGIGGRSHAVSGASHSGEEHNSKGIRLQKANCADVELNWNDVAKRIGTLIRLDRYLTAEEKVRYEQMQAEDDTRSDSNIPELLARYKPAVIAAVTEDTAYRNACGHSDMENAMIEGNAAVRRAVLNSGNMGLVRAFSDVPEFRERLHREVFEETYTHLHELLRPLSQDDIDDAIRSWNGDVESKRAVVNYMEAHARERDTAEWLAREYGGSGSKSLFIVRTGSPESAELPWSSVQRRIAQLIQQDKFFTEDELDNFEDIDVAAVREHLESGEPDLFVEQVIADVERITAQEAPEHFPYSVGDTVYLEDGQPFIIENIGKLNISLRDPSLAYPILRAESRENFARLMERYPQPTLDYTAQTVAIYPAEENHLPYDIVIQTIKPTDPTPPARNFRITDDHLGAGGPKAKFRANMDAINLLKELESDGRQATPDEQEILSRYVGWGGLADAFDDSKENWKAEYAELSATLTPEEYAAARSSTLNAHYTSPTVIKSIYEAVGNMGFTTGNILEPAMGVGNFFGLLPDTMSDSKLYGVELDSITGRIAKQLYPNANITVAGFETTDRRDFFDLAIGNVPFGDYKVNDRALSKLGFSIHNYFFAKALDQVRPGGVVAFVTSRYTLDAKDSSVRKYLAERADFLGAIRLPNNAFRENAGTDVVSDIIFLQKRDRPIAIDEDWIHLGQTADGFTINSYFVEHPEMMLGIPSSESTQYGHDSFTLQPIPDADLADQLHAAVQNIRGTYQAAELPDLGEEESIRESIPADPDVKNYSYAIVNGEVYYRENSIMVRPELNATAKERIKGMAELRDCVQKLITQQMDGFVSDDEIRQTQSELNELYDGFTAKYGLINDRVNRSAFSDDSSYYLLCSLEILDDDNKLKRKADMFTKRTIKPHEAVTSVDTASEALAVSIAEKAKVDLAYMAELTGKAEEELTLDLRGVIFLDPILNEWQTADEYLSGNVREKLKTAETAAETDPAFFQNVEALRAAQPKDLDASEIEVRLGATWIDKEYIRQFMIETFEPPFYMRRSIEVNYSEYTAEWSITNKANAGRSNIAAYMTYGTDRANAYKILEDTLNLRDVRIYDTVRDSDGKERRVLNSKETTLAQQKQQAIKDAFRDWIWRDPTRRQELTKKYNVLFNSTRPREYDGRHIRFVGMNPEIQLREHQLNAIAHVLYGGNTLLAHEVGAGKTFEMAASAMESKRLGLCEKPLFAVPNHLTEQWASEFLRLYPSANILVATKKDFEPQNRKKFCARIATGSYDAVIIGHSQFEKIPVSKERQETLLREQIDEIEQGIEELKYNRDEKFTVKQLEKTRKGLEVKLKKLHDDSRKDDVVTFEQLGVDRLFVDEAHSYKNLFLYTKMRNVAGLSTSDAQKSSDMFMKCRYLDEITGSRGTVFATGTPVSNSMTELYTMMRYLQHDTLQKKNLMHFDCWASTFGETSTAIELAPEGTGYRARTRFSKFFNLPELMTMFKEVADIKTSDQLNLPTPTPIYHNIVAHPTETQEQMVQELSERAAKVHARMVDPSTDNMLKITSDGRKLGLDQRIINPNLPDEPQSKVNLCVENIFQIYTDGHADRLTQLVFCDLSTPKADEDFSVYTDVKQKLMARGVPAEEIAFIHDADTEAKKKELFSKVRSGNVRVLMGSTSKMGAGMNVQDRLIALHDLDAPWRPGDLEQRSGRIIRQGNMNPEVHIYRYVTEKTFDSYLWQTLENKQKFISQIMTSKSLVRSCDDIDETALSYAEIKALCAGDARIKEKMDLDVDVARLKLMKANFQSQRYRLEDDLLKRFPEEIKRSKRYIEGFTADMKTLSEHPHPKDGFAGMEVKGDFLTDRDNAGAAVLESLKDARGIEPVQIGAYRGFAMLLSLEDFGRQYVLTLKGEMSHRTELGKDVRGNLIRIDNALNGMENRLKSVQANLESLYAQVESAKAEIVKPFPQEDELKTKSARLAELNAELNLDERGSGESVDADEPEIAKGKPSVLGKLKSFDAQCQNAPKNTHERENKECL